MEKRNIHKNYLLLTNIQRFSLHDGPGIRTTVFLKGCSLRCPWCSNPENLTHSIQSYIKDGVEGTYGEWYTVDLLYKEVMKDRVFYDGEFQSGCWNIRTSGDISRLPGGVTFSGGECLLQMDKLEPLMKRLKSEGVHMAAETCLFAPIHQLAIAIQYIDLFYIDVKILNAVKCNDVLHGNLELYRENLDMLLSSDKPVVFRVPVIGGYTDDMKNRGRVVELLREAVNGQGVKHNIGDCRGNVLKVELIKEHNLAKDKWQSLAACNDGYDVPEYKGVSDELMEEYCAEVMRAVDIPVEICKV